MKSYAKPTAEQLDAVIPMLSSPQHEAYFFARLENPNWIQALAGRDVFRYPPKPEPVEGGGVRFPPWSASQYLARMAALASNEVAAVFAEMETDNPSVMSDILKAALAMPPAVAVGLTPTICRAAREGNLWFGFKDASDLCVRLGKAGHAEAVMELADALFTPSFDPGQEEPNLREMHWYREGLKEAVPLLVALNPQGFLQKVCGWLKKSVEAKKHLSLESANDYSYVWRPAIEEHAQNSEHDFAGILVGFVRQGFEEAIGSKQITLQTAFAILDQYSYLIFERIRLYLLAEFAEKCSDLARETILNRELFENHRFKHEYAVLAGRRFDMLSPQERDVWFGWIRGGPDMCGFEESARQGLGREPTPEDCQRRINYWQFEKLHLIRDHLDGELQAFYAQVRDTHGEPELADLNMRTGPVRWGSESPMKLEMLSEMPFEQAVDAVSSWRSEKPDWMGPNTEGLSSTFGQYVAAKPEEYSSQAEKLIGRPAIFVRQFIGQMSDALKAGREIDLGAVLELCRWVVDRPVDERTTATQSDESLVDKNWQWTRDEISRFIEMACKAEDGKAPRYALQEFRKPICQLIERLHKDQPTSYVVRDPSKEDPRVHDYLNLGINAPRGKALEAAFEYARWVATQLKQDEGTKEFVPGGFDSMPEIRELLEWQITPVNRTFEALAVVGSRINIIYWIDKEWLAKHVEQLFRLQDVERTPASAHGWAAWNAFLVWVMPHAEYFRIFETQFRYAVMQAEKVELPERDHDQPMHRLGEHLMILYGRGVIELEGTIIQQFLDTANADVRRHAMGFIGRSVEGGESIPVDVARRFMAIWDYYWARFGKVDAQSKPDVWLFGPWFASGQFPKDWALECLAQFVEINPTPEPSHEVAKELAGVAQIDISKAVRILDCVIRGDREGWRLHAWLGHAQQILELAMNAEGDARHQAERLVDFLGRRGYSEFGKLLVRPH